MAEDDLSELRAAVSGQPPQQPQTQQSQHQSGRDNQVLVLAPQKPVRQRTNLVYVMLLVGILAATAFPTVRGYIERQNGKFIGGPSPGRIMFLEAKCSFGKWEQVSAPDGWEVKAAFYRPPTKSEPELPGRQLYVLVLQEQK